VESVTSMNREPADWARILPVRTQSPRRVSARDLAYDAVRDAIVKGVLPPGESISEDGLAQALDVSRTPLREALERLQGDALVERARNGRLFVRGVSAEEAANLFAVRIALEDLAITEASARMTEEVLAKLRFSLDRMKIASSTLKEDVAEAGHDFHDTLYRAAGNPINQAVLDRLQGQIDRYRFISTRAGQSRRSTAVCEHEAVYSALRDRNVNAARRAMRKHLLHARESVVRAGL
jgi:DNA-binding GntR family transcriptional regulator